MIGDHPSSIVGPKRHIYGWSKIVIFAHILPRLSPMTSKPPGNHLGNVFIDSRSSHMILDHSLGIFGPKWRNLWMIQNRHFHLNLTYTCSYDLETFRKSSNHHFKSIHIVLYCHMNLDNSIVIFGPRWWNLWMIQLVIFCCISLVLAPMITIDDITSLFIISIIIPILPC